MRKPKIKTVMTKADTVFSQFVRLRDANNNGIVQCCTCKKFLSWREAHAGHYIVRQFRNTRYDERNVNSQCCYCNTYLDGNAAEYTKFLEEKYGLGVIGDLLALKNDTRRVWKHQDYQDVYTCYNEKVKQLKKQKGII